MRDWWGRLWEMRLEVHRDNPTRTGEGQGDFAACTIMFVPVKDHLDGYGKKVESHTHKGMMEGGAQVHECPKMNCGGGGGPTPVGDLGAATPQ
ncbi:hypothetical protein PIB30_061037 [Stylosanthes scabra]|uniref:Uncharacterized protein n=1 Tax=Stylosanthes scabra TaxID=79078 RepID=A0ABU6RKN8_9FABA|nr:hypothetical protein [Stylosanthes scabra]